MQLAGTLSSTMRIASYDLVSSTVLAHCFTDNKCTMVTFKEQLDVLRFFDWLFIFQPDNLETAKQNFFYTASTYPLIYKLKQHVSYILFLVSTIKQQYLTWFDLLIKQQSCTSGSGCPTSTQSRRTRAPSGTSFVGDKSWVNMGRWGSTSVDTCDKSSLQKYKNDSHINPGNNWKR